MPTGGSLRDRSPLRLRDRDKERDRVRGRTFISPPRVAGTPAVGTPTAGMMSPLATHPLPSEVYASAALRAVEDNLAPVVDALAIAEGENLRLEGELIRTRESTRRQRNGDLAVAAERAERIHASTVHATEMAALRREVEEGNGTIRRLQLDLLDKGKQEDHITVGRLKVRIGELEHETESLRQQLVSTTQHVSGLTADCADLTDANTQLRLEVERSAASAEEMAARNSTLRDSLALTVAELNAHMHQSADGCALLEQKIKGMEMDLEGKLAQAQELLRVQQQLDEAQHHIHDYDSINHNLSANAVRLLSQRALAMNGCGRTAQSTVMRRAFWKLLLHWLNRQLFRLGEAHDAVNRNALQYAADAEEYMRAAAQETLRDIMAMQDDVSAHMLRLQEAHAREGADSAHLARELEAERARRQLAEQDSGALHGDIQQLTAQNAKLARELAQLQRFVDTELGDLREDVTSGHQRLSDDLLMMWKKLKQDVGSQMKKMSSSDRLDKSDVSRQEELSQSLEDLLHKLGLKEREAADWKRKATEGMDLLLQEQADSNMRLLDENNAALRKMRKELIDEASRNNMQSWQLEELEAKLAQAETDMEQLQKRLSEERAEKGRLTVIVEKAGRTEEELDSALTELERNHRRKEEELQRKIAALKEELAGQMDAQALQEDLQMAQQENARLTQEKEKLRKEIEDARKRLHARDREAAQVEEDLEAANHDKGRLQKELAKLEKDRRAAEDTLKHELSLAQDAASAAEEQCMVVQRKADEAARLLKDAQADARRMKEKHEDALAELNGELLAAQAQLADAQRTRQELVQTKTTVTTLHTELEDARIAADEADDVVAKMKRDLEAERQRHNALKSAQSRLENDLQSAIQRMEAAEQEVESTKRSMEREKKEKERRQRQMDDLQTRVTHLEEEAHAAHTELLKAQEAQEGLRRERDRVVKDKSKVEDTLASAEQRIADMQAELDQGLKSDALKRELEALRREADRDKRRAEEQISELESQFSTAFEEAEGAKMDLEDMRKERDRLRAAHSKDIDRLNTTIADLQDESGQLAAKLRDLTTLEAALRDQLTRAKNSEAEEAQRANEEADKRHADADAHRKELNEIKRQLHQEQMAKNELSSQIVMHEEEIVTLEEAARRLRENMQQFEEDKAAMRASELAMRSSLAEEQERANEENMRAERERTRAEQERKNAERERLRAQKIQEELDQYSVHTPRNEEARHKLVAAEAEIERLRRQLAESADQLQISADAKSESDANAARLRRELSDIQNALQAQQTAEKDLQRALTTEREERVEEETRNARLRKELADAKRKEEAESERANELDAQLKIARREIEALQEEAERSEALVARLRRGAQDGAGDSEKLQEAERQLAKLRRDNDALKTEGERADQLAQEVARLKRELQGRMLDEEREMLEQAKQDAVQKLNVSLQENMRLEAELDQLRRELEKARRAKDEDLDEAQERADKLERKLNDTQHLLTLAEADLQGWKDMCDKANRDLEQARAAVDEQTERAERLERKVAELQRALDELEDEVQRAKALSGDLVDNLNKANTGAETKKSELARLKKQLKQSSDDIEQEKKDLEAKLLAMERKNAELQRKNDALAEDMRDHAKRANEERKELRDRIRELEELIAQRERELSAGDKEAFKQVQDSQKRVAALLETERALRDKILLLEQEVFDMRQEREEKEEKLKDFEEQYEKHQFVIQSRSQLIKQLYDIFMAAKQVEKAYRHLRAEKKGLDFDELGLGVRKTVGIGRVLICDFFTGPEKLHLGLSPSQFPPSLGSVEAGSQALILPGDANIVSSIKAVEGIAAESPSGPASPFDSRRGAEVSPPLSHERDDPVSPMARGSSGKFRLQGAASAAGGVSKAVGRFKGSGAKGKGGKPKEYPTATKVSLVRPVSPK